MQTNNFVITILPKSIWSDTNICNNLYFTFLCCRLWKGIFMSEKNQNHTQKSSQKQNSQQSDDDCSWGARHKRHGFKYGCWYLGTVQKPETWCVKCSSGGHQINSHKWYSVLFLVFFCLHFYLSYYNKVCVKTVFFR